MPQQESNGFGPIKPIRVWEVYADVDTVMDGIICVRPMDSIVGWKDIELELFIMQAAYRGGQRKLSDLWRY